MARANVQPRRIAVGVALFVLAAVLSRLLYELMIVPKLAGVAHVPWYWWVGASAPLWVTVALYGARAPVLELAAFSAICALMYVGLDYAAATLHAAATGKHRLIEGGWPMLVFYVPIWFVLVWVCAMCGYLSAKIIRTHARAR